ncbi:acid protease [Macrolepiota fuliginosa MF-IS2]|uniref:Acid protease n=1 Tax=Macrolepiota fuliginosa MF-IS2 TaxID=1400762 RepID=A0A9P5XQH6_9AGAR|nr:acid protease [Macrolepiota fuliginosa MF-IS2]
MGSGLVLMHLTQFFVGLLLFSTDVRAGPLGGMVSIPLEKAGRELSPGLPSAVLHQQYANRGIRRLAHMKGQPRPSDLDLWGKISNRLSSLPKDSEFMRKLEIAALSDPNSLSSRKFRHLARATNGDDSSALPSPASYPNSLGLEIQSNDYGYYAKLMIGTPPKEFSLLMDSGSADFWVGGEGCKGDNGQDCGNHTYLGLNSSTTLKDLHDPWAINYNTGEVSGSMIQDDISIAGLRLSGFKFGVAFKESPEFTGNEILFDGLAGLAKSAVSRQRTMTLVEALHKSGVIKNSIVSFKIPRLADHKNDGEMALGGMNPAKYDSKSVVTVKNLNRIGFWETPINEVKIDGKPSGWTNRTGVLDTGTALLMAPREDVDAIHSRIPGAKQASGSWTVPCATKTSLALTIGNIDFSIDPRDLAFIPADDSGKDCWSGIGVGTVGPFHLPTTWLLGNTFLKNVYSSMNADEGKDEISFAKLR